MSLDIRPPHRVRPLTKKKSLPLKPAKVESRLTVVNKPTQPRRKAESGQLKWVVIVTMVTVLLLIGIVVIRKLEQSEISYSFDKTSKINSSTKDRKEAFVLDQQKWRQDFSVWQKDFNRWQEISAIVNQLVAEIDDLSKIIMDNEKQDQK